MNRHAFIQLYIVTIAVILGIIFYLIFVAAIASGYQRYEVFLTPLLLVVIAVILLGIFSVMESLAYHREARKK